MVGQRFLLLVSGHPWFELTALAASAHSAGKPYRDAVAAKWHMPQPIPPVAADMTVFNAVADAERLTAMVDFVFCAVDMGKNEIRELEERYARLECPVVSNNSAHRWTPDVPMVVPEINPEHIRILDAQRRRLGTRRGFIAVKSNCSLQSYVPALHPLMKFGIDRALVCTYQAISGAGKTFETWPEMIDNVIPFIGGEEEKSEQEPLKLWGHIEGDRIVCAASPSITAQCLRVPVTDGHMAACFLSFAGAKPSIREIKDCWRAFPDARRNSVSPPHRSSFCTTLRRTTARRQSSTGCLRAAWPSPSAVCVRIRSMTTSSSACLIIPCAVQPAAPFCLPSCSVRKDISPQNNEIC